MVPDPVPINDVFRSAVTVPLVLGATEAIAGPREAIFAGLAAMLVVLGERSGTTGQRMFKAGAGFLAGTFAMTFGPLTTGSSLVPLGAVVGFAVISGVLSSFGAALFVRRYATARANVDRRRSKCFDQPN